jgi:hypothetical protein
MSSSSPRLAKTTRPSTHNGHNTALTCSAPHTNANRR